MPDCPPQITGEASTPPKRRLLRVVAAVYTLLLAFLSLAPGNRLPTIPNWSQLFSPDKVGHFGAYALFALLLSACSFEREGTRNVIFAVLAATVFGTLLEVLQAVAGTGRSFDPVDMVANALGAILGGLMWLLFLQLKKYFRLRREVPE